MLQCNKNRDTFGIIIGSTYTLCSLFVVVSSLCSSLTTSDIDANNNSKCGTILTFLTAAVVSALFVLAIVKKLPKLMIPWLLLCVAVFLGSCLIMFAFCSFFFGNGRVDVTNIVFLTIFLVIAGLIGIEIAISLYSFWLYFEIYDENLTRSPQLTFSTEITNCSELSKMALV